jgi:formate transporter
VRAVSSPDRACTTSSVAYRTALLAMRLRKGPTRVIRSLVGAANDDASPRIDALLPPAMAQRAEQIGVDKVAMAPMRLFALAVLAGSFIALGGAFATTVAVGTAPAQWGLQRLLVGVAFSLGLILVVVGGAELFTGNNLIVMAWAGRRVSTSALLRNWLIVFVGNAVGAVATALLVFTAGVHRFGGGAWGTTLITAASAKLGQGFVQAIALGVLCNALVCLAVWMTYSARSTTDRILAVVPPISAFVAIGFEHSIANLYFLPLAIFITVWDPIFVTDHGLMAAADSLSWVGFLRGNLVPVMLGNIIGGSVLVASVYWFVYLSPAIQRADR